MKGRTAIVTGSTSGIGLAIAHALAAAGVNIVLNGRGSEDEHADLVGSVARHGTRVAYESANMLRHNQIAEMVERTEERFGSLDILVNNAGIQHVAPVEDFPIESWDSLIAINLTAPFVATRAAVPGMKRRGFGRIVNVCSVHAMVASPFKAAYVAAKHGLIGLTKVVALELAGHNVTCNAISPGFVLTPLVERQIPDLAKSQGITEAEARQQLLSRQPTGEFVNADDVGALAVFLAGDAASAITGANFAIDGGWTAQ
jgi:3-hydroxybutyrate dehydrogenase